MAVLMTACGPQEEVKENFTLKGTWVLKSVQRWEGERLDYDSDDKSWLRIYDDTCYYECQVITAPSGKMFEPTRSEQYTLIERGPGDYLYLQDDNTHPLSVVDDSTIVIQEMGWKYTWRMCHDYDPQTVASITGIIRSDMSQGEETSLRYVISYAERELQTFSQKLIYSLIIALLTLLLILNFAYRQYRNRKQTEQVLRQLKQERESRPEPIRKAMTSVEEDFHTSDFYLDLKQKISRGERLSEDEWEGIEERFKSVYPRFTTTLLSLRNMSATELHVCQLLKLNVTPTEIATVLCKDKSSISSIRSRLYSKVFDRKGSSKDWDEFIRSL